MHSENLNQIHIQGVSRVVVDTQGCDNSGNSKTEILYTHMLFYALFCQKYMFKLVAGELQEPCWR